MPSDNKLHEPWASFLDDVDARLTEPTEVHCLGGFVIAEMYGLERPTADVDILHGTKGVNAPELKRMAGRSSELRERHKVYLDIVTVVSYPDNYESRLVDLFPERFRRLHLKAFERHDLVLAKLERNEDRDREDLKRLAAGPGLDVNVLQERYQAELRFQMARPDREDLTLQFWIEIIREVQEQNSLGEMPARR